MKNDHENPTKHKVYETVIYNFVTNQRFALLRVADHCNAPDCKRDRHLTVWSALFAG